MLPRRLLLLLLANRNGSANSPRDTREAARTIAMATKISVPHAGLDSFGNVAWKLTNETSPAFPDREARAANSRRMTENPFEL